MAKDIHRMLSLGMFPEGHLDEKKTCLMLNDSVHSQYLEAEKARMMREQEKAREKAAGRQNASAPEEEKADRQSGQMGAEHEAELNTMVAEGMECIRKLRELNDQIPEEAISQKLFRLENLLKDIFDSVREHPEQMHRMHKLMDYYLPTTLKLLRAYETLDKQGVKGENIRSSMHDVEMMMDTIIAAFEKQLDNLFQEEALDISSDISVMETMLAQEGLSADSFSTGDETKSAHKQA